MNISSSINSTTGYFTIPWLVIIILSSTCFKFIHLESTGLWQDEQFSLISASGIETNVLTQKFFTRHDIVSDRNLRNVIENTFSYDNGNGLFFNILSYVYLIFLYPDDFNVRLISVIFTALSIFFFFKIAWILSNKKQFIAIPITFLFSMNGLAIEHGQTFRMYSLVILLSSIISYLFILILDAKARKVHFYLFTLVAILLFFTHFLTAIFVGILYLVLLIYFFKANKLFTSESSFILFSGVIFVSVVVVFYLINISAFARMSLANEGIKILISKGEFPGQLISVKEVFLGIVKIFLRLVGFAFKSVYIGIGLGTIGLAFVFLFFKNKGQYKFPLLLVLALSGISTVVLGMNAGHNLPFMTRYSVYILPLFYGFLTIGLVELLKFRLSLLKKMIFLIVFGGLSVFSVLQFLFISEPKSSQNMNVENFNSVLFYARILDSSFESDTIVYRAGQEALLTNLYLTKEPLFSQRLADTDERIKIISENTIFIRK